MPPARVGEASPPAPPVYDRLFDVRTHVAPSERQLAAVEFVHCGVVHFRTDFRAPDAPLPPHALERVCDGCPAPVLRLALRCHVCGDPMMPQEQGGGILTIQKG